MDPWIRLYLYVFMAAIIIALFLTLRVVNYDDIEPIQTVELSDQEIEEWQKKSSASFSEHTYLDYIDLFLGELVPLLMNKTFVLLAPRSENEKRTDKELLANILDFKEQYAFT
jgi:hypothetical protein